MLVVRLQRRGRKKHAQYRIVVQDSHRHPTSGKVIAYLGSYNPHTKAINFDSAKTLEYVNNGAQPSERVVRLLLNEKAKLPKWVKVPGDKKSRTIRNAEKLRKNRPVEETPEEPAPEVSEETPTAEKPEEPTEAATETVEPEPVADTKSEEEIAEASSDEAKGETEKTEDKAEDKK
jgi:small subunit ribosomal protein S16